jgi:hypothetical protein
MKDQPDSQKFPGLWSFLRGDHAIAYRLPDILYRPCKESYLLKKIYSSMITSFYFLVTLTIKALVSGILVFGSPVGGVSRFALSSAPVSGQRHP